MIFLTLSATGIAYMAVSGALRGATMVADKYQDAAAEAAASFMAARPDADHKVRLERRTVGGRELLVNRAEALWIDAGGVDSRDLESIRLLAAILAEQPSRRATH